MNYFKITASVVLAVVIGVAIYGAYQYPQVQQFASASPVGTNFLTSKVAQQTITTATDTVYAVLNTDANARTITGTDVFLTGGAATTTLYSVQCATSTVATGLNGNTNYTFNSTFPVTYGTTTIAAGSFDVATSSGGIFGTSTSVTSNVPGANYVNNFARVWPAGTYMVCKEVSTGVTGYNQFDAGMTGYIGFPYRGQ